MRTRYFHGWNVVAATFVMALLSFGLGFYGLSVYVATLQRVHGWSASVVSAPVTVYYVAGALLTVVIADLYARFGPRSVVATGGVAMAAGLLLLGRVATPWQLYPAFLVMSVGWGAMSGAAINIILAPWFERRRGLVVSLAFNGATLGGVFVTPALLPLIDAQGFRRALATAAFAQLAVLALAARVMGRGPADVGLGPDGDPALPSHRAAPAGEGAQWRRAALRTWRFWSVSAPFALGLAAQVGVLTHLVALVAPVLGTRAAGHWLRRRPTEPSRSGERDPLHPDGRTRPPRVGALRHRRLRGLRPLRSRGGKSHHAARARPGRGVAARALQLVGRTRGGNQPVYLRLRPIAGRRGARRGRRLPGRARCLHGTRGARRRPRPARARPAQRARRAAPGAYTSGLTTLIGRCPVSTRATSSPQRRGTSATAGEEKYAACGVAITLSMPRRGLSAATGSRSHTSRAAPARRLSLRAWVRASSSTTGPREVLMRMAVGFMRLKKASPMRWRVSALRRVCTET